MMHDRAQVWLVSFLLILGIPFAALAEKDQRQAPQQPPAPVATLETKAPPIKMLGKGLFEIGGVRIIKKEHRVEFPAAVNMDKGLLEYLVVGDLGKLHESLLRTRVEPYSLQIALLLLGLEGSTKPLTGQGAAQTPEGDPVDIFVRWENAGKERQVRIEEWVDLREAKPPEKFSWIFTGSVVYEGVFMAQIDKSIVAVFHDPAALIDHRMPAGANDEIWYAHEKKVPPPGTPVTVIIQKKGGA
ncbi:YdjY domain-containing protein [Thermodesulfobacteriota bacterium]